MKLTEISVCNVYNSNPTVPDDGFLYTEFTSLECSGTGGLCRCGEGIQARLVAPAILAFLVFSCGFPIFIYYIVVVRYRDLIKEDQLLRAAGLGDTPETNPKAWGIRQRYEKLYYQ